MVHPLVGGSQETARDRSRAQKERALEIKVDIASKMAETISYQLVSADIAVLRKKKASTAAEEDAYYEYLKKSYIDASTISSKLESYFSETQTLIPKRWDSYCTLLRSISDVSRLYFYEAHSENQKRDLRNSLEVIRLYFRREEEKIDSIRLTTEMIFDADLWNKMRDLISEQGEEIVKDVLKLPIKVF